jgi:hypothetical protein
MPSSYRRFTESHTNLRCPVEIASGHGWARRLTRCTASALQCTACARQCTFGVVRCTGSALCVASRGDKLCTARGASAYIVESPADHAYTAGARRLIVGVVRVHAEGTMSGQCQNTARIRGSGGFESLRAAPALLYFKGRRPEMNGQNSRE